MKMVPVSVAVKQSGYTRTWVHELARTGVIASKMLTDNFKLVDLDALMEYAEAQRKVQEPVA